MKRRCFAATHMPANDYSVVANVIETAMAVSTLADSMPRVLLAGLSSSSLRPCHSPAWYACVTCLIGLSRVSRGGGMRCLDSFFACCPLSAVRRLLSAV